MSGRRSSLEAAVARPSRQCREMIVRVRERAKEDRMALLFLSLDKTLRGLVFGRSLVNSQKFALLYKEQINLLSS